MGISMKERLARAMAGWTPNVTRWRDICEEPKQAALLHNLYLEKATTILRELLIPTDGMVSAGARATIGVGDTEAQTTFQAAIQAAIEGE